MNLSQLMQTKILVVGDFMVDKYIRGGVKRISPEAPVPIIEVDSMENRMGGSGNVAHNLRTLGAQVRVLTCLGNDPDGVWLMDQLKKLSVDTDFIFQGGQYSTITKTRVVSKNQQFLRMDREKPGTLTPNDWAALQGRLSALFEGIQALILSDYGKGLISPVLSQALIGEARSRGVPVLVDPKGSNYSKYAGATLCTPNYGEFLAAVSMPTVVEEEILATGLALCERISLDSLLITRSERGMSLISSREKKQQDFPAQAKEVIDVTGAGDTVVSVMAIGLALGEPMEQTCVLANQAAAVAISKFGAATVTFDEIVCGASQLLQAKILYEKDLPSLISYLKKTKKKVVFTNGCFDLLHVGHLFLLEKAREMGDLLVVGLNSDRSVRQIKGERRPIVSEIDRAKMLCAMRPVDWVIIYDEETPYRIIEALSPDFLVKGGDWEGKPVAGEDIVKAAGGSVRFIDLQEGFSTTNIVTTIKERYGVGDE